MMGVSLLCMNPLHYTWVHTNKIRMKADLQKDWPSDKKFEALSQPDHRGSGSCRLAKNEKTLPTLCNPVNTWDTNDGVRALGGEHISVPGGSCILTPQGEDNRVQYLNAPRPSPTHLSFLVVPNCVLNIISGRWINKSLHWHGTQNSIHSRCSPL